MVIATWGLILIRLAMIKKTKKFKSLSQNPLWIHKAIKYERLCRKAHYKPGSQIFKIFPARPGPTESTNSYSMARPADFSEILRPGPAQNAKKAKIGHN